jgi:ribonuclease VapC
MSQAAVLDASAILAVLKREPGRDRVIEAMLVGATLSTVNLCEVAAFFARAGRAVPSLAEDLRRLGLAIEPLTTEDAMEAGDMIRDTAAAGLSLADRSCLALAKRLGQRVLTADCAWSGLNLGIEVVLVR